MPDPTKEQPTIPGYYRAAVYVSLKRQRVCHQVVAVTDRPVKLPTTGGYALERVILQVGSTEAIDPSMVAGWWGAVDPMQRDDDERVSRKHKNARERAGHSDG